MLQCPGDQGRNQCEPSDIHAHSVRYCQCAIQASSTRKWSGTSVRSIFTLRGDSILSRQPSTSGPMILPCHAGGRSSSSRTTGRGPQPGRPAAAANAQQAWPTCQPSVYFFQFAAARRASSSLTQP